MKNRSCSADLPWRREPADELLGANSADPSQPQADVDAVVLEPQLNVIIVRTSAPFQWFLDNDCGTVKDFAYGFEGDELPPDVLPAWFEANDAMDSRSRARARAQTFISQAASPRMALVQKRQEVGALAETPERIPRLVTTPVTIPQAVGGVAQSTFATSSTDRAKAIKDAYAERLFSVLTEHIEHSSKLEAFASCGGSLAEDYSRMVQARLVSFSVEALRGCVNAIWRWCRWCSKQEGVAAFPPSVAHVAIFLRAVAEGDASALLVRKKNSEGAGASEGVRSGLRFAQLHLGFSFAMGDEDVETAGSGTKQPSGPRRRPYLSNHGTSWRSCDFPVAVSGWLSTSRSPSFRLSETASGTGTEKDPRSSTRPRRTPLGRAARGSRA